jgi:hypothetical protein
VVNVKTNNSGTTSDGGTGRRDHVADGARRPGDLESPESDSLLAAASGGTTGIAVQPIQEPGSIETVSEVSSDLSSMYNKMSFEVEDLGVNSHLIKDAPQLPEPEAWGIRKQRVGPSYTAYYELDEAVGAVQGSRAVGRGWSTKAKVAGGVGLALVGIGVAAKWLSD